MEKCNSFIKGALILAICGVIGKFIGALYRIPLTGIIGAEGLGLYQLVFPLYSLLLTLSSSAFPTAIAKMLSQQYASGNNGRAASIFTLCLKTISIFSLICFVFIVVFAKTIATAQGNENASICYYGIAPAIIFVAFLASFRGYFQAKENMTPLAVSGLIEQVTKLMFGLVLAKLFLPKGVQYGALGALIGVSISEFVASLYVLVRYLLEPKQRLKKNYHKGEIKNIFAVTLPITLGSLILPLSQFIDSMLIVNLLKMAGYSATSATRMFGIETGIVGAIVNMPVVFSLSLSSAVLPVISRQCETDRLKVNKTINKALLLVFCMSIFFALAIFIFAPTIISILFGRSLNGNDFDLSCKLLRLASISVCYLSVAQITTGILNGMGKHKLPVISLLVGGVIKLVTNVLLVQNVNFNIFGAEIATIICYGLAAVINTIFVYKMQNLKQKCIILSKN